MTEAEWLAATDPAPMLKRLVEQGKLTDRKTVLFASWCVRRCWTLLDARSRLAVTVAEHYAEGLATREELREAWLASVGRASWAGDAASTFAGRAAARAASWVASMNAEYAAVNAALAADREGGRDIPGRVKEKEIQAAMLRHIAGNPFRPVTPTSLPRVVCDLVEALYLGIDCAPALHDALLDADLGDLASHFHDATASHPRGCWVLDLLLSKE